MGAGIIPFSVKGGKVWFLFQRTFEGRKVGYLIDFGGGGGDGETYRQTAVREFIEETETMYFSSDIKTAMRSEQSVQAQIPLLDALFERTLTEHPDWWCQRDPGNKVPPKDWRTFFVEVEYRDLDGMNYEWEIHAGVRFKKRRELVWVQSDVLYGYYNNEPERLWKRVRQLMQAKDTIKSIMQHKEDANL
ncbi:MAG: hypothetical protein EP297_10235 [Gammaproteobacteria bacterium]|nr:MAG: hypothetical protein EP297_10235 [Gammaproteobacteria bacterium]